MYDPVKYFYEAVELVVSREERKSPFRRSGCERRYFANAIIGHSYGFFGFEYTCHRSLYLYSDWSPFVLEKLNTRISFSC